MGSNMSHGPMIDTDLQTRMVSLIATDHEQQIQFTEQFVVDAETRDDIYGLGMEPIQHTKNSKYRATLDWARTKYPAYDFTMFMQCDEGEPYGFVAFGDLTCTSRFEIIKRS